MSLPLPAQIGLDFEDLLKFAVVALAVLGAVLAPVIKKFRGTSDEDSDDELLLDDEDRPVARPRPAPPVARPLPPRPQAGERPARPPAARPYSTPVASSPTLHPTPAPTTPPQHVAFRSPAEQRVPAPPAIPTRRTQMERPAGPTGPPPKRRAQPRPKPEPTAKQTVRPTKKRTLAKGLSRRETVADAAIVAGEIADDIDAIRRPTRASLRRAIVLREVLGPPLALRPFEDPF